MLTLTVKTKNKPAEIVKKAVQFFGEYGLKVKEQTETSVNFEGGGGYVSVDIKVDGKSISVDLETREWETPVKEFAVKIK